jgi:hypothetical protein
MFGAARVDAQSLNNSNFWASVFCSLQCLGLFRYTPHHPRNLDPIFSFSAIPFGRESAAISVFNDVFRLGHISPPLLQ